MHFVAHQSKFCNTFQYINELNKILYFHFNFAFGNCTGEHPRPGPNARESTRGRRRMHGRAPQAWAESTGEHPRLAPNARESTRGRRRMHGRAPEAGAECTGELPRPAPKQYPTFPRRLSITEMSTNKRREIISMEVSDDNNEGRGWQSCVWGQR